MDQSDAVGGAQNQIKDDLFSVIGAADLPEDEKGELLMEMMDHLQTRALARCVEEMDDDRRARFQAVSEGDDDDALDAFLENDMPEYEEILMDEARKLRQELIIRFAE